MISMNKKTISYIGLFFVVFVWGLSPLLTLQLYQFYSPTIRVCFADIILVITYTILSKNHLKEFNMNYIKVGVPTGLFLSLANITQKIGLLYTTPAKYAFLETFSSITVPILMFILVKKKPKVTTIIASFLCLISAFVLNGMTLTGTSWGIGEILCALSGLLYGFNIAGTGIYAKKLHTTLYLATQSLTSFVVSLASTVLFHVITLPTEFGTQIPIEQIKFSFHPLHIGAVILLTLICSALCWTIRTNAMKYVDASIVAIIMPFSAAITSILSVLFGTDTFDLNLVLGVLLGLAAIFLSNYADIFQKHSDSDHAFSANV